MARGRQTTTGRSSRHAPPSDPAQTSLDVIIEKIFWAAKDSEFKMMACRVNGAGQDIVVKGHVNASEGDRLRISEGKWKFDARYGWSFQISKLDHSDPTDLAGLESYLQSMPGIGPVLARQILDQLGTDCLSKIDQDLDLLRTVKTSGGRGLRAAELAEIMANWEYLRGERAAMLYLGSLDISNAMASRLYGHYGSAIVEILKTNPYKITEVDRIGFRLADRIGRAAGLPANHPSRLAAGVEYSLEVAESSGHIFMTRDQLHEKAAELLGLGASARPEEIDAAIGTMSDEHRVIVETFQGEERIYTAELFEVESSLYELLQNRLPRAPRPGVAQRITMNGFTPTEQQWRAVDSAVAEPVSIMTGGPGVGKTMTLQAMVATLEAKGLTYSLAAPTGKAAKRMSEATGRKAQTIHRLIGFDALVSSKPGGPIRQMGGDVLIVDEASMLDMRIAERLLAACPREMNVVFVGDPDQLPPVGAGSVFLDMISSGRVPSTRLTQVFRQSEDSMLLANANRIKEGLEPFWSKDEAEAALGRPVRADWQFIETDTPVQAAKIAVEAAERHEPEDVLVVSPTKNGDAGVHALNTRMQEVINPDGAPLGPKTPLRQGDTVLFTRNDYALELVNGDLGQVETYDAAEKTVTVVLTDGESRTMSLEQLNDLSQLGYAITVHKSQGSQAPHLISTLTTGAGERMLSRNLIYTAWTRAQRSCTVIGSKEALRAALKVDGSRRDTTLDLRVATVRARLDQRQAVRTTIRKVMDARRPAPKPGAPPAKSRSTTRPVRRGIPISSRG
ncbi:SF1B family DNA helicase RecD2 [Miltoncostaea oceani]|uniref:SF1B family DNA helicase RecD2 n=1 Tax=Miltoncostaea oceani TaxID=2843216 RepID=UPI001C3D6995|nr:AAA family ATPase [Miltoncostaea oceani]